MSLVIKGAVYFDGSEILIPHYTGDFSVVDCDRFCLIDYLEAYGYDEAYIEEQKVHENYIKFGDKKYYFGEYSPYDVNSDWELLSDLSDLVHDELNFEF